MVAGPGPGGQASPVGQWRHPFEVHQTSKMRGGLLRLAVVAGTALAARPRCCASANVPALALAPVLGRGFSIDEECWADAAEPSQCLAEPEKETFAGPSTVAGSEDPLLRAMNASEDSKLFVDAVDYSDAMRYAGCFVFAHLHHDFFSASFAPVLVATARAFPHVVFVQVQGRRMGNHAAIPKRLPVLLHMKQSGPATVFHGSHDNVTEVMRFVAFLSGQGPTSWTMPQLLLDRHGFSADVLAAERERGLFAAVAAALLEPAKSYAQPVVLDFVEPPPEEPLPLAADPAFACCTVFLAAYTTHRVLASPAAP